MKSSRGPVLSPARNDIDRIRLVLDVQGLLPGCSHFRVVHNVHTAASCCVHVVTGPCYTNKASLHSLKLQLVKNFYYTPEFSEKLFREVLVSAVKAER